MPTWNSSIPTQTAGSSDILASDWNTFVRDNTAVLRSNALSGMGELIETLNPSSVASIATSATLTAYTHLGFFGYDLTGSANTYMYFRMNADNGSNYEFAGLGRTTAGTTDTIDTTSGTSIQTLNPFLSSTATRPAMVYGFIPSRGNTSLDKAISYWGYGQNRSLSAAGLWKPGTPAAITALTFGTGSGTFSGTICIYGINN